MRLRPVTLLQRKPQVVGETIEQEVSIVDTNAAEPGVALHLIKTLISCKQGERRVDEIGVFWRPE